MNTDYVYKDSIKRIKKHGEHFPKKHGDWYRIKVMNSYLLLDTWNGRISVHAGRCEPSGKDIYGAVVCFNYDDSKTLGINFGSFKVNRMLNFWRGHIPAA